MTTACRRIVIATVLIGAFGLATIGAQAEDISTRIGTLSFENGFPSKDTATKLYDEMDFQRATQAYLWSFPAVSNASIQASVFQDLGATFNDMIIFDNFLDTKSVFLTGNTTTIYALALVDLAKDGPVVLEVPPGPTAGMVDDFWFRAITEVGRTGPDAGKGGKFPLVPPGYKGDLPKDGYFIVMATMNNNNILVRGLVQNGDVAAAKDMMTKLRVYPYSQRDNPKPNRSFSATGKSINSLEPEGLAYWLSEVINNNPVHERDRFFMAMLKPLGIEKGKPFAPDARQKKILEEGERVGRAMAITNSFDARLNGAIWYPGTNWMASVLLEPSQESENYSELDERLHWFYVATYMNPHMALTQPGPGSVYIQSFKDKAGQWLDSAQNYRLRIPANPPAKDFWSITVYDSNTRSMIQNAANKSALTTFLSSDLKTIADGSVDLYFGPKAPQGLEFELGGHAPVKGLFRLVSVLLPDGGVLRQELVAARHRESRVTKPINQQKNGKIPVEGWFRIFRIYGTRRSSFFDLTWKLNAIEKVK